MSAIVTTGSTSTTRATPATRRALRIGTGVLVAAVVITGVVIVMPTVEAAGAALIGAEFSFAASRSDGTMFTLRK